LNGALIARLPGRQISAPKHTDHIGVFRQRRRASTCRPRRPVGRMTSGQMRKC
jgi:hypothetical protein